MANEEDRMVVGPCQKWSEIFDPEPPARQRDHSAKKSRSALNTLSRKRRGGAPLRGLTAAPSLSCSLPRSLAHSLIPPMFHPSSTLFHGVKWRITHLGNVLSIDRNEGAEADERASERASGREEEERRISGSWSFGLQVARNFLLSSSSSSSLSSISQTRFSPPPLDRPTDRPR